MASLIIPQSLSSDLAARVAFVQGLLPAYPAQGALLRGVVRRMGRAQTAAAALLAIHRLQRIYYAAKIGVLDHPDVLAAIDGVAFPLWQRYTMLRATPAQRTMLADLLYRGDPQQRPMIFLSVSDYSRGIAELVLQRAVADGHQVDVMISDPLFQRRLLTHCTADQAAQLGQAMMAPYQDMATRTISLRIEQVQWPFPDKPVKADIQQAYNNAVSPMAAVARGRFYTVTVLPTPKDAVLDNIPYARYRDLFFRMCAVDWAAVDQAHRVLIAQLNAAKTLRFTNADGTDVTMDIDGFTFCNSLVAKNVPGSEIFSAPRRDSVTGTVVGKGRYLYQGRLMENIMLRFAQGRVVEYRAEIGQDVLTQMIETDAGSQHVGEIGIGTNPVLRTHLVNGLLVEKIGGSFHLALGNAYQYTDYLGTPVVVDNGNRSAIHEDLTFMLYGKSGCIFVDGQIIMTDGRFLDPRLAVLNGGN